MLVCLTFERSNKLLACSLVIQWALHVRSMSGVTKGHSACNCVNLVAKAVGKHRLTAYKLEACGYVRSYDQWQHAHGSKLNGRISGLARPQGR